MADPKGLLVVPVGYRADGSIHALELDNSDRLKVLIDSITGSVTVAQTNPANLQTGLNGWYGGSWQKAPIPFGASGIVSGIYSNTNLPAGTSTFNVATVPAGEYWNIKLFNVQAVTATATILRCGATLNGSQVFTVEQRGITTNQIYINNCDIFLFPGDTIDFNIVGATLNDDLVGRWAGYRVDIDQ